MSDLVLSRFYSARQSDYTRERVTLRGMIDQIRKGSEKRRGETLVQIVGQLHELAGEEAKARAAGDELLADRLHDQRAYEKSIMLPAVTPAGVVVGNRNALDGAYVQHSGLVVLDFDHFGDPPGLRDKIMGAKRSAICAFVSPSGDGVKVFVAVNPLPGTPWEHELAYAAVVESYGNLDIEVDTSGRDVSRLCFYSLDPQARIRRSTFEPRPVRWEVQAQPAPAPEPTRPGTRATSYHGRSGGARTLDVPTMLSHIPPDERETWLQVGMALHSDGQEFELWRAWSETSAKYNERDCDYTWRKFKPGGKVTMGTLWHLAREHGWPGPGVAPPEILPAASPAAATSEFVCSRCGKPADHYSPEGEALCEECEGVAS